MSEELDGVIWQAAEKFHQLVSKIKAWEHIKRSLRLGSVARISWLEAEVKEEKHLKTCLSKRQQKTQRKK